MNASSLRPSDIKIGVLGGDRRQLAAARAFAEAGYETAVFGLDVDGRDIDNATRCGNIDSVVGGASLVLLPLPYTKDHKTLNCPMCSCAVPLDAVFEAAAKSKVPYLYGGLFDQSAYQAGAKYGFSVFDYYRFEGLCEKNAAATAEAALSVALTSTGRTLFDTKALVIGYGRIGRYLARLLAATGTDVTVAARSEKALAQIAAHGYRAFPAPLLAERAPDSRLIFNTVPALLYGKAAIEATAPGAVYIELASQPGIDREFAESLGLQTVDAPSLPGRIVPISAGGFIKEAVEGHFLSLAV